MKKTNIFGKTVSALMTLALITALALSFSSCGNDKPTGDVSDPYLLGDGAVSFTFVCEGSEKTTAYIIKTDKTTLADALLEHGLIAGDDGPYGLYVKTVCGETLDYDTDGKYWALWDGDNYASVGAGELEIQEGARYTFKATGA